MLLIPSIVSVVANQIRCWSVGAAPLAMLTAIVPTVVFQVPDQRAPLPNIASERTMCFLASFVGELLCFALPFHRLMGLVSMREGDYLVLWPNCGFRLQTGSSLLRDGNDVVGDKLAMPANPLSITRCICDETVLAPCMCPNAIYSCISLISGCANHEADCVPQRTNHT